MPKILILMKDEKLREEIAGKLNLGGLDILMPPDGELPQAYEADIILLDEKQAGLLTGRLKDNPVTADLPLFAILTGGPIDDHVLALIDEIEIEPIHVESLNLKIKRLLLRAGKVDDKTRIRAGELCINLESYEVSIDRKVIELTYKEYELIKFLAGHPGRVYNRQTLLNQIWEYDYFGGTRTVDVHIRRLRAKLGSKYGAMIQTVRHVGYRFSSEKEVKSLEG